MSHVLKSGKLSKVVYEPTKIYFMLNSIMSPDKKTYYPYDSLMKHSTVKKGGSELVLLSIPEINQEDDTKSVTQYDINLDNSSSDCLTFPSSTPNNSLLDTIDDDDYDITKIEILEYSLKDEDSL